MRKDTQLGRDRALMNSQADCGSRGHTLNQLTLSFLTAFPPTDCYPKKWQETWGITDSIWVTFLSFLKNIYLFGCIGS